MIAKLASTILYRWNRVAYAIADRVVPPRDREKRTFRPKETRRWLSRIILATVGLILSWQITVFVQARVAVAQTERNYTYYQNRVLEEQARAKQLEADYVELQAKRSESLNQLFEQFASDNPQQKEEWEALQVSSYMAGITEVKGPGIRFTLADKPGIDYSASDRAAIIHDADVRNSVNLLKATMAAQAMAVNGERMIASSKLICAGPMIIVNRNYTAMPFVLEVCGDPDTLVEALESSELYAQFVRRGLVVKIERLDEVTIPPFYDEELMRQSLSYMQVIGELSDE